jgi:hypothetical protein
MSTVLERLESYLKDDTTTTVSTSSLLPEGLLEVVLKGGVWAYEENESQSNYTDDDDWQQWSTLIDGLRNQILYDAIDAHKEDLADDEAFFELAKQLRDIVTMTYDIFIEKVSEAPVTLQKYFKPSTFLMFPRYTIILIIIIIISYQYY